MNLLSTVRSNEGENAVLICSGCAETESLESLERVLLEIHDDALESSAEWVVADVRELEFASSSCLKVFVKWLQRIQELEDERRYKVMFRTNPRHPWQRRSLNVLAAFAPGIVEIQVEAAG